MSFKTMEWLGDALRLLDQRVLPKQVHYVDCRSAAATAEAIRTMVVRGAPAIGASAAYGMALAALDDSSPDLASFQAHLAAADDVLRRSRPTAVNLFWALDRMQRALAAAEPSVAAIRAALLDEAQRIAAEDAAANIQMGLNGLVLVPPNATIIHHCNTGTLAATDYGTALGVIRTAHEHGRAPFVLVDETRPRLQGARLTAWELQQYGIAHKVIVDGASGHYMRTQRVDLCIVGCDRVAANGDTANKIGTYNLACAAKANGVPFYIAAPSSTIDFATPTGDHIEIEERSGEEVTHIGSEQLTPDGVVAGNPAFDVTPAAFITAIITEKGVVFPPFAVNLARLLRSS